MMRYEAYKHSGVDWIGEIPEDWKMLSNKYIFNLKKNQVGKNSVEYELLSLTLRGIIKRDMENPEGKFPAEFDTYQEVKKGDFVFCLFDVEETPRTVGLSDFDGMITGAYTVFNVSEKVNRKFLYYFYLNLDEKKRLKFLYKGLRNTIPKDSFFTFKTAVPPIAEQQTIAQFLDDKTAKIDQTIAVRQKEIELLKERRQILIQQAVTKGLDATVQMKDSGVDWIGEIPEHWEVIPMRRLIDVRDGTHDTPFYIENSSFSHYLITSKDFEGDDINYTQAKSISRKDYEEIRKRSGVETGDVIMSMIGGNIGKSVIISTKTDIAIKNVGLFKTKGNITMSKYIRYYLQSGLLKIQAEINSKGGAQSFLSLGDLRNLRFFKMPFEDMVQIVNFIEVNISKIAKAISIKEQEIEKLKEYKTVLIDNVVTGKVRVS